MRRFRFGSSKDDGEDAASRVPGGQRPAGGDDGGQQGFAPPPQGEPSPAPAPVEPQQAPPPPAAGSEWLPLDADQPAAAEQPPPPSESANEPPSPEPQQPADAGRPEPIRYQRQEPRVGGDQPAPIEAQSPPGEPQSPAGGDWFDDDVPTAQEGQPEAEEYGDADVRQAQEPAAQEEYAQDERSSRVSVVDEPAMRPAPPAGASEEEYKWHTYKHYPSGRPDAVEFIDTYKAFGRNKILRGLNMGLPEGMVSMILGPSGTGKSVCIKHMVGLLYPDDGDILVHGHSVPNMRDDDLFEMRKKFGLLFQDGALFGSMNIFDNVAFPLRQHTEKGEDEVSDIVSRRLNEVGLGNAADLLPNELSGGMRKRAGFARALVLEPDIVLFDEPDSGLDPVRTALLGELILEIHRDMMDDAKEKQKEHLPTFAVITHDIMSARRVADYINVLWKGRIVEAGPAEDMLNSDNPFIRQFLAGESQGPLTMD
jgi:phospholipid/cholesterol/gamma-HCH transport system ATP-binding protein